ncbi:Methylthioribose-1-phosphate isomerase [hydrothermal vent metagenome]|uniref:Methylthioribose-1-phosphate isomerase n=1 Tax=hydrothermal vent metagenome TaxID=652676 RepID=A0A3B0Y726_9ZZZZ
MIFSPIIWQQQTLKLLDQRKLPEVDEYIVCHNAAQTAQAITDMVVRGAPAIGVTAAWGVVLSALTQQQSSTGQFMTAIQADIKHLSQARPTAINLEWALQRMQNILSQVATESISGVIKKLENEAHYIHQQDIMINQAMGELGANLITEQSAVLTHCNAGALATGGYGTALGVIRSAYAAGKISQVYADETRPWLQGSRLTAWELARDNIPVTLIVDSAAAWLMQQNKVAWVIVGADRVAANGDVANKIGTYSLAVNARYHGIKLMVVAPTSTIDLHTATGAEIPIEQRNSDELLSFSGQRIAAACDAWNPVFDITPAKLVDVLVTEKGVVPLPDEEKISRLFL